MATLLTCQDVTKAFGLRVLFDGMSISFSDGERVGFLGPNGAGKTTFMKMLAGLEPHDGGTIHPRRSARIIYLPQTDSFVDDDTVESVLQGAVAPHYPQQHERDTQVNITLSRFGFTPQHDRVSELSGGWRKRLALARAVIQQPDLLLMDEPTNHLDLEGILWLEGFLEKATFTFVVVSHDRYFLEHVTNRVVELSPAYPDGYFNVHGPYSLFLEKRADFLEAQRAQQVALSGIVRREAAFLKSHAKARRTKSKARVEEAYRLHAELRELQDRTAVRSAGIDFDGTGRKSRKLLEAKDLAKAFGDNRLFENVSLLLSPGSRVGLLGANGSGKTTFIRVLTGELEPDCGSIRRAEDLRIVLFDQKRESLPQQDTLRQALSGTSDTVDFRGRPVHVSAWAKRFLFRMDQMDMPVGELSGGEQSRILIARLMLQTADILILDEPTNDLDIASLDVLEESLSEFPGAVVLVTHDRFMLDRLCTEVIGFHGDGVASDYANCEQWLAAIRRKARAAEAPESQAAEVKLKKPRRGGLSASEQKELQDMEETIQEAEALLEQARVAMHAEEVAADHVEAHKRWETHDVARQRVESLYARWQELEAKIES